MTCGKWGQPGHEGHICTDCTDLIAQKTCKDCQIGCTFKKASPERLKLRDEAFGMDKQQRAVEKVLKALKEEKLTIRESHIVLGKATRQLLEMDLCIAGVRA
jgi:hypothetical protein